MSALHAIQGRIVDARRYINLEVYWRRPPGPTERYELWVRQANGHERKFTINTRTMPARRDHDVSVIVKTSTNPPQVLGLFNASTLDAVNYMGTDAAPLLRVSDFLALPVAFVVTAVWWGDAGMVLFVPMALIYLLAASSRRAIKRTLWRARVERALADEAARNSWRPLR